MGEGFGATHFNWRGDVADFVARIEGSFFTAGNTYVDHPNGFGLDHVSVDFWSPFGRGFDVDPGVGQAIHDFVFNDPNPPWIRWVIWQGFIWIDDGFGFRPYDDPFDLHFDHVHFTFW